MDVVPQFLEEVFVLKIRIKFTKTGNLKFIGHLDVMRYFQKLNRRAGIDMKYSQGFNPHQIMSFAQPLGIGLTSVGEYVDIEVNSTLSSKDAIKVYNEHSVPEIQILSYKLLADDIPNAMSQVAAADYVISFREGYLPDFDFETEFTKFMCLEEFMFERVSKKTTKTIDIMELSYGYKFENDKLGLRVSTGSVENLKPETVLEAFYLWINKPFDEYNFLIERTEVYGIKIEENKEFGPLKKFVALEDFGEDIE